MSSGRCWMSLSTDITAASRRPVYPRARLSGRRRVGRGGICVWAVGGGMARAVVEDARVPQKQVLVTARMISPGHLCRRRGAVGD